MLLGSVSALMVVFIAFDPSMKKTIMSIIKQNPSFLSLQIKDTFDHGLVE